MNILLIEPDRILSHVYAQALTRVGHEVVPVRSAQAAVHAADKKMPDVVVLEIQLPNHNGVEFLYEFRSYPEWLDVPVIIHTMVPLSELAPAATLRHELGVVNQLYKPVTNLAALCAAVAKLAPATV